MDISAASRASQRSVSPITVTIFLTSFVAVTYAFGIYLFSALVPEVRTDLAIGQDTVGLLSGSAQAGNMTFAIVAGFLVPRLGPIRAIYLFLFGTVICQGMLYAVSDMRLMVIVLFVIGGMSAAVWIAIVVVSQALIPNHHRGKALGLMSSGTSFGLLLNGILVPYILQHWDWRAVWLVFGIITLAVVIISLLFLHRIWTLPGKAEPDRDQSKTDYRSNFFQPAAIFSILLLFGTALSLVPYQTYLTSLLHEDLNWTPADASRAWGAIGLGGMFGGVLLGMVADKISVRSTLIFTYLALVAAMPIPVFISKSPPAVFVSLGILGMSYFALFGLIAAYVAKMFSPQIASMISGSIFVAVGFGSMIGNFLSGQIIEATKEYVPVYITLILVVALLLVISFCMPSDRVAMPREPART